MTNNNFWLLIEKYIDGELTTQENKELLEHLNDNSHRAEFLLFGKLIDGLPDIEYSMMKEMMKDWKPD